jgi:predicted secreted protein
VSGSHETTLISGQHLRIRLKGLSSAGYVWTYTLEPGGEAVVRIKITQETLPTPVPFRSFSLDQIAVIEAVGVGKSTIRFVLRRPWQKQARSNHEIVVTVV